MATPAPTSTTTSQDTSSASAPAAPPPSASKSAPVPESTSGSGTSASVPTKPSSPALSPSAKPTIGASSDVAIKNITMVPDERPSASLKDMSSLNKSFSESSTTNLPNQRDSFRFDFFGSNSSLSSLSALSSFSSLPSLPSLPSLLDPKQKLGAEAHRDTSSTTTSTSNPAANSEGNSRLPHSAPSTTLPQQSQSRGSRPLPPLQPLPAQPQPQPQQQATPGSSATTSTPQSQAGSPQTQAQTQQTNAAGMNALVATQNSNRRIINPVTVPNGQNFVDITEYLNMPQSEAAKKLNIPPSTLSKRWKEAVRNRKWPWRVVCKLDKEIMTLLHNVPQGAPIPEEIEGRLGYLMRKRQEELKPVVIRL